MSSCWKCGYNWQSTRNVHALHHTYKLRSKTSCGTSAKHEHQSTVRNSRTQVLSFKVHPRSASPRTSAVVSNGEDKQHLDPLSLTHMSRPLQAGRSIYHRNATHRHARSWLAVCSPLSLYMIVVARVDAFCTDFPLCRPPTGSTDRCWRSASPGYMSSGPAR